VYAAWACRADQAESARVGTAGALLDRQRRRNAVRLDWIADRFASDHRWPAELARRYLGTLLRYDPGPREREGAERFLTDAASLGLIGTPRIAWGDAGLARAGAALPA
jgi:predicted solute-binding protein